MTVLIRVDTNKPVGDKDHLKVFANEDAAETCAGMRLEPFQRGGKPAPNPFDPVHDRRLVLVS